MVYTSEYPARRVEDSSEKEDGVIFKIWISDQIQNVWMTGQGRSQESSQHGSHIEDSIVGTLISTTRVSMNIS
jgi:hypothetical protein